MWGAFGWGAVAASSLALGALLGILFRWRDGLVGAVLAFGAGALISAVSFDLAEEGLDLGPPLAVATGVAVGALTYFLANRAVSRLDARSGKASGAPLALGAFLDGIPEQAVLGIGLAAGAGVSPALLGAIFVSNLPEAIGSVTDMRESGSSRRKVFAVWLPVALLCALATLGGFAVADLASDPVRAGINGFAAGALLVMMVDSMIPEAKEKAGDKAGLATVLGFAVAAWLSFSG